MLSLPAIKEARTAVDPTQFQWVRMKNVGAESIPPWSIVEVVEVEHSEPTPSDPPFTSGITYHVQRPSKALAYQLASTGPFTFAQNDYAPGLTGSLLVSGDTASLDDRALPTKDSFSLRVGDGGPLVCVDALTGSLTLWHYDPSAMDSVYVCVTSSCEAADGDCESRTLTQGSGDLMLTSSGSFVKLEESIDFQNALESAFAVGDTVALHRNANGEFHTVGGQGNSAEIVVFQYEGESTYPAELPEECIYRGGDVGDLVVRAKITKVACGGSLPDDYDEYVGLSLTDPLNILDGRDLRDLPGRKGIAVRVSDPDSSSCEWVIVFINFFREVQVVNDVIFQDSGIVIERSNVKVWDDCMLPDEIIEGIDCEDDDYPYA